MKLNESSKFSNLVWKKFPEIKKIADQLQKQEKKEITRKITDLAKKARQKAKMTPSAEKKKRIFKVLAMQIHDYVRSLAFARDVALGSGAQAYSQYVASQYTKAITNSIKSDKALRGALGAGAKSSKTLLTKIKESRKFIKGAAFKALSAAVIARLAYLGYKGRWSEFGKEVAINVGLWAGISVVMANPAISLFALLGGFLGFVGLSDFDRVDEPAPGGTDMVPEPDQAYVPDETDATPTP